MGIRYGRLPILYEETKSCVHYHYLVQNETCLERMLLSADPIMISREYKAIFLLRISKALPIAKRHEDN